MNDHNSFATLIERLRAGDNDAARSLLTRYEPALRRIVAMRLMDRKLSGLVDAEDICQSVFGSFFVRLGLGQYEIGNESDLLRLLATMVRNKVVSKKRHRSLEKRDDVRVCLNERQAENTIGSQASPSESLIYEDLMRAAEGLISTEERELIALRKQGFGWGEIANRLGDDPERLRKRLARTVDLVIDQLGLDEVRRGKR
ncbi:MAG TPA: sigma-70 family RNA polymerase sigma factor [Gemmata sp.]|nr:sigma-70 family RNA polymerase sigma factor [Gemmata sp.]